MAPAFSSLRQAGMFALLLLLILLLPVLAGKSFLPTREQLYSSMGRDLIDFPYFHQQIFEEKGDIDIAFMGSSRMGAAIDAPYVQEKLSERLGRKAVVRSLTWTWNGYDALYFIAQDLLQHRNVHMIVFYDLSPRDGYGGTAHRQSSYWFRFADNAEAMAGLPMKTQASFYASAIFGMPRNLVGLLRFNLPATNKAAFDHYRSPTDYTPRMTAYPSDVRVYSEATKSSFRFSDIPLEPMQLAFVRKVGLLAQEHQTELVCLHLSELGEMRSPVLQETTFWPDAFRAGVPMVGIPPASLFAGMTDDEVLKLYFNPTHFNQNGRNYFTPIVTPSLVRIYEDQIKP